MSPVVVTVDLGNTNPHYALFSGSEIKAIKPIAEFSNENIPQETPVIISSVKKATEPIFKQYNIIELPPLSQMKFLDMPVNYSASLGEDRLVQSYYLYKNSRQEKIVLIDIGTFMTIDFISQENGFEGGYIFPGIETFLNSYTSGQKLPSLSKDQIDWKQNTTPAQNTYEAISSACKIYLTNILNQDFQRPIILTGGDSLVASELLKDKPVKLFRELIHHSLFYLFQQLHP